MVLNPGVYEVRLKVEAKVGRDGLALPYAGHLGVAWLDPGVVTDEPMSWGTLKAFYRR